MIASMRTVRTILRRKSSANPHFVADYFLSTFFHRTAQPALMHDVRPISQRCVSGPLTVRREHRPLGVRERGLRARGRSSIPPCASHRMLTPARLAAYRAHRAQRKVRRIFRAEELPISFPRWRHRKPSAQIWQCAKEGRTNRHRQRPLAQHVGCVLLGLA